ncbi:MAG: hypothetical protein JST54_03940 [Deltaproteobacteria bacterium]|nr:hypothetical protein [Deltaproteobacteria bacterium]
MYCPRCSEERGPKTRFCVACGGPLEDRPRELVQRDLQQHFFLIDAVESWERRGDLPGKFAKKLSEPYRERAKRLEATLDEMDRRVSSAEALLPKVKFAEVQQPPAPIHSETASPAPVAASHEPRAAIHDRPSEPAPETSHQPPATSHEPASVVLPAVVNELVEPPKPVPEPVPAIALAADAAALASGAVEGPLALTELGAPPPSKVEKIVERESSWNKVWRPFLYDNAIWFVGAFCIVSGSLYVASQAYLRAGSDVARSLIVFSMMTLYAAAFGGAGFLLGEKKQLTSAGRILSLIGAAVAPVALVTLDPLREQHGALFLGAGVLGAAASTWLLKLACDRFDDRMSLRVAATGGVLLAWELAVPWAASDPRLCALVPLAALFSATGLMRVREPAMERASQAFGALSLLYLAAFDLARLHFSASPEPGLELYGPVTAALGWIAMRADVARVGATGDRPKVPATTLAAMALLAVGALASLVAEASAAAAAMVATLAFADAARTYRRSAFVAIASVLGLFAYYLSPDLIRNGVAQLLAAARQALGYAPSQSLPVAYAGVSTVPYLVLLGFLARRAHAKNQPWLYRPLGWSGAALTLLLTVVAHSSTEVRPGLWSSIALTLLLGAALWLADHAAAGYLFGWVIALLGWDVSHSLGGDTQALFAIASGLGLVVIARIAPDRQRPGMVGEALFLAAASVPWALVADSPELAAATLGAAAVLLVLLALETRSQLPAYAAACVAVLGAWWALQIPHPAWIDARLLLAPAFLALIASGFAHAHPPECEPGTKPFGAPLPWPASGFWLARDPLALFAGLLGVMAVLPTLASATLHERAPDDTLALALGAVLALGLARRHAFGWGAFAAVTLGALACAKWIPALAIFGLLMALVAVAFEKLPKLARSVLRDEGPATSVPPAIAALLIPMAIGAHVASPWLALGALAYVVLLRWRDAPALWLPLAFLAAWWATEPQSSDVPGLSAGALALGTAVLGLVAAKRPRWVELAFGGKAEGIALTAIVLVLLAPILAGADALAIDRSHVVTHVDAAEVLALFAMAYLLLAHQTENALALFAGAAMGVLAAAFYWPTAAPDILLGSAIAFGVLANLARALGSAAEAVFGPKPAKTIGYALGVLALLCISGAALCGLDGRASDAWWHLAPYAAALVVFLSARALGWAPLQPAAVGLLIAAELARAKDPAHATHLVLAAGAAGLGLALLTRRFPSALTLVFLDRSPDRGRAQTLRWSMLVAMLLAIGGALSIAAYDDVAMDVPVAVSCALLTLAALAAPGPLWWPVAGVLAMVDALGNGKVANVLPAFVVLNVLLALAGLLRVRRVERVLQRVFGAVDAEGDAPESFRPYAGALSMTAAWTIGVGVVALALGIYDRLDLRRGTEPTGLLVAEYLPIAALHLLWRRRGVWALGLVYAALVLPVAYVAPVDMRPVLLALTALPFALIAWRIPNHAEGRLLARVGLAMPARRRKIAASLAFATVVLLALAGLAATGFELGEWQTPATAAILTVALVVGSLRERGGRFLALALLPLTAHLALAWLGVKLATGRPHEAILGAWALASAGLAVAAERFAQGDKKRADILVAAHLYFVLGALELGGAMGLMNGMLPKELAFAALAAALLGTFATLRALDTGNEIYAYLAQLALLALYLLVRIQTDLIGARSDRDALASVLLGFAFLGLHALAKRADAEVFDRPMTIATHALPLVGLVFVPHLDAGQAALYAAGLAMHYAAVSASLGGSKIAAVLSGIALNAALAVTWASRGINDPQFYAIPFGATLLAFARIFRKDLSDNGRFWMRTVGILTVYLASVASSVMYDELGYVMICAVVCVVGVLLGVMLRVKSYVYLGTAVLVLDVLSYGARRGLHNGLVLGIMLTLLGFMLVGGWVFFLSKREELLRRYAAVQALMRDWE